MHISRIKQVKIYVGKCFRIFKNEKGWISFLSTIIIAFIICSVTGDDMFEKYSPTRSGAFAIVSACIWVGIFNSIRSICKERAIIKREHRTGLHISSYVTAHMIYEAVISFVEALLVAGIVWITNWGSTPRDGVLTLAFVELFVTFFLIIYSSDALGILISSIVKSENTAMTVMPFVLIIQLVMSGMIFELSGFTKKISTLTISRWGLDAICVTCKVNEMELLPGQKLLEEYDPTVHNLLWLWMLLAIFTVIYAILSIISLEFVDKDKR